ncbi:hypothetical protein ETH_00013490 [Eimeria tenella]|uniref:Uncharacterized protein n=1 Tax=Eimeria tenella TaxID=5802 RepID=U6L2H1_EIMTE|nr:hypothetical protein ETH_00013490 [Eimeria tenella]CDJ43393.1 hypothetical protein ETH_00013490 [Eimeria tenella]|eukprot:XP_013234143.1 hypothetical protein ETH_00013490 [Eimeria tenella]
MGEALHYDWFASPTNNRDSGLLPQATRPISGRGLPVVEVHWKRSTALKLLVYSTIVLLVALCGRRLLQHPSKHGRRIADVDWGGDSSSLSDDDENNPCGDLRIDDRQTSPGVHDESPPQSDAASTQAPGTGAAEEGVSISCEDESSGDAAAAAPEAAADDEDDDSNSNCSTPIYDIVCSGQGRTSNDGDSKVAESHDAPAAPGRESVKSKMGRLRRAKWMRPLAGFLESAGKKISSLAAPEAAADDEDDDSNSNCGTPVYDIVCSGQGRTSSDGDSKIAAPHDAPAAPGRESMKRKMDRLRRARWMGPVAGFLESAGKKISSLAPKSAVAASPAAGGVAGETAASSSEASQSGDTWSFNAKLAVGDSRSPHYKDLRKPYDFPHLKAENYTELRRELLKLAESIGDLCSPHTEPFQATVKADCDISGVGRVTLYLQIVEEDMKFQRSLRKLRGRIISDNPFSRRFPERFTRDLLALAEELSVTVSDRAQKTKLPTGRTEFYSTSLKKPAAAACTGKVSLKIFGIKADAEDIADRDGEQGEPKTDAPIQPGNRASGSSADELVDPVRTVQATVGDAAAAAASDVATAGTSGGTRSEASEAAGSPKGAHEALHGSNSDISLRGRP